MDGILVKTLGFFINTPMFTTVLKQWMSYSINTTVNKWDCCM